MSSLPHQTEGIRKDLVQQVDAQLHWYLQRVKCPVSSHYIGGQRHKKSTACLMNIKHREDETLRSYITCFNKEAFSIDEADDKIVVVAFMNRLQICKLLLFLYKNDSKTMLNVLYKATKYMNAEDALLAREKKLRKRERQEDVWQDRGRKMARTGEQWEDRRSKSPRENS